MYTGLVAKLNLVETGAFRYYFERALSVEASLFHFWVRAMCALSALGGPARLTVEATGLPDPFGVLSFSETRPLFVFC